MPRWFDSLQFRMIIGFTAVLALALAGVSVYVGMAAQKEVERYESQMDSVETNRAQMVVSNYYSDRKDWSGLQPLVERIWPVWNQRLIIYNEHGKIVADSHASFVGVSQRIVRRGGAPAEQTPASPVPVLVDNRQVGALSMDDDMDGDMESPDLAGPAAGSVLSAVNRSLVWTGIAAAVLGTLLIALLSGRVLSPVQSLGAAALRLGRGDLTQRAPASGSAEIKQLAASFNAMAANLEEAERYRRDLAADVAHELRTPVSNIQGYLEAIKDGLLEPSGETIDVIYSQVTHLSRLVEDLRLLAQVESGALRLDRLPSPVPDLLQRCLDAARPRAEASGIQLSLATNPATPLVEMDSTRIAQVVDNLLDNAITHTPESGSVSIAAVPTGDGRVEVSVSDTGNGILEEDLPRLFDRFYRADPSRSRSTGGAGLGLTIAKQLVEAHGGTIEAASAPGSGSTFSFRLPVTAPEQQD